MSEQPRLQRPSRIQSEQLCLELMGENRALRARVGNLKECVHDYAKRENWSAFMPDGGLINIFYDPNMPAEINSRPFLLAQEALARDTELNAPAKGER